MNKILEMIKLLEQPSINRGSFNTVIDTIDDIHKIFLQEENMTKAGSVREIRKFYADLSKKGIDLFELEKYERKLLLQRQKFILELAAEIYIDCKRRGCPHIFRFIDTLVNVLITGYESGDYPKLLIFNAYREDEYMKLIVKDKLTSGFYIRYNNGVIKLKNGLHSSYIEFDEETYMDELTETNLEEHGFGKVAREFIIEIAEAMIDHTDIDNGCDASEEDCTTCEFYDPKIRGCNKYGFTY